LHAARQALSPYRLKWHALPQGLEPTVKAVLPLMQPWHVAPLLVTMVQLSCADAQLRQLLKARAGTWGPELDDESRPFRQGD
jgi:hypothetical protein